MMIIVSMRKSNTSRSPKVDILLRWFFIIISCSEHNGIDCAQNIFKFDKTHSCILEATWICLPTLILNLAIRPFSQSEFSDNLIKSIEIICKGELSL